MGTLLAGCLPHSETLKWTKATRVEEEEEIAEHSLIAFNSKGTAPAHILPHLAFTRSILIHIHSLTHSFIHTFIQLG